MSQGKPTDLRLKMASLLKVNQCDEGRLAIAVWNSANLFDLLKFSFKYQQASKGNEFESTQKFSTGIP